MKLGSFRDLEKSNRNVVFKDIYAQHAVRNYRKDTLPDDTIKELIWAGSFAPSAMNEQPWRFVVIKYKSLMKKLSGKAKELWIDEATVPTTMTSLDWPKCCPIRISIDSIMPRFW
jgi:hypothetical protein